MSYDPLSGANEDISPRAYELLRTLQEQLKAPTQRLEEIAKVETQQINLITTVGNTIAEQLRQEVEDSSKGEYEDQYDSINELFSELISEAVATTAYVANDEYENTSIDEGVHLWIPSTC